MSEVEAVFRGRERLRAAYKRALIKLNRCPKCGRKFGPQYSNHGNTPQELICDCDGQRALRVYNCVPNEDAIRAHIAQIEETA